MTTKTHPLKKIAVDSLSVDPALQVRELNSETDEFRLLVASMRRDGFLPESALAVVTGKDEETDEETQYVIDGQRRLAAAKAAGLETVWICDVTQRVPDEDAILYGYRRNASALALTFEEEVGAVNAAIEQLKAAGEKVTTKKLQKEFGGRTTYWVNVRRRFDSLCDEVRAAFEAGEIGLAHLDVFCRKAKMSTEEQLSLLAIAKKMSGADFGYHSGAEQEKVDEKKAKSALDKLSDEQQELLIGTKSAKAIARQVLRFQKAHAAKAQAIEEKKAARDAYAEGTAFDDGTHEGKELQKLQAMDAAIIRVEVQAAEMNGAREALLWALGLDPKSPDLESALESALEAETEASE